MTDAKPLSYELTQVGDDWAVSKGEAFMISGLDEVTARLLHSHLDAARTALADAERERDEANRMLGEARDSIEDHVNAANEAREQAEARATAAEAEADCLRVSVDRAVEAERKAESRLAVAVEALRIIMRETEDREPPYRAMDRQAMIDVARAALRDLTAAAEAHNRRMMERGAEAALLEPTKTGAPVWALLPTEPEYSLHAQAARIVARIVAAMTEGAAIRSAEVKP